MIIKSNTGMHRVILFEDKIYRKGDCLPTHSDWPIRWIDNDRLSLRRPEHISDFYLELEHFPYLEVCWEDFEGFKVIHTGGRDVRYILTGEQIDQNLKDEGWS